MRTVRSLLSDYAVHFNPNHSLGSYVYLLIKYYYDTLIVFS